MTDRPTASTINDAQLDQLYAELAALRQVARGYCPHCGRGDAAPSVEDWEQQKQRADHAEAALEQVRDVCDRLRRATVLADGQPHTDRERGVIQAVERVLAALAEPTPDAAADRPSRWLHVVISNPDEHTANRTALSIRDWLTAEFDGIRMQITTNARDLL